MEVEEDDRMRRKTVTRSLTAWPHGLEKKKGILGIVTGRARISGM